MAMQRLLAVDGLEGRRNEGVPRVRVMYAGRPVRPFAPKLQPGFSVRERVDSDLQAMSWKSTR